MISDPTQRFSNRVDNYVKYRPSYPTGVIDTLAQETGLAQSSTVADVGSGTGISAELFLKAGCSVLGVEPNRKMREAAEKLLRGYPAFRSIAGTAEATTLPDNSVDYAIAAQAFHWFEPLQAGPEISRILKPGGWIALLWNSRRTTSTPFLKAYESLLQTYGTDYQSVGHKTIRKESLETFTGGSLSLKTLYNEQILNLSSLKGRLLSSSYIPQKDHPNFQPMMTQLTQLFEQYNQNGQIRVEYDTELYWGHSYR
ncbi:MAG: class I SAM-dependent methyltransferase [Phormidesmis sp.]